MKEEETILQKVRKMLDTFMIDSKNIMWSVEEKEFEVSVKKRLDELEKNNK